MNGRESVELRRRGRRRSHERGAVAVEFALVLPILVGLLLGTITAGLAYSQSIGLTNAVREGSRFGATADLASGTWTGDVIDRIRETQFDDAPDQVNSSTTVCVEVIGATPLAASCSTAGDNPPAAPAFPVADADLPALGPGECLVKVWAARRFQINAGLLVLPANTMTRHSVARYERGC